MARRVTVDINDLVDDWRTKTNTISLYFGDLDQLQTSEDSDLVGAINEINTNAKDSATIQSMIDSAILENNNIYFPLDSSIRFDSDAIPGFALKDRSVTEAKLALDAVTGIIIADNAIDSTHVDDNAITRAMIQDFSIDAGKIASNTITSVKLASVVTLQIKDSSGSVVKTIYSPGS